MQYKFLFTLFLILPLALEAQLLFPGDLNNDGEANHIDLLPLAIAYGQEGPERPEATLEWIPQETFFWGVGLPVTGVDLAFVDADGNGLLDSLDLDAIPLNYDSTQMEAIPPPQPYLLTDTFPVDELPRLLLSINQDEVGEGDTIQLTLSLEIPNPDVFPLSNPPTALACIIDFDPTFINEESIFFVPNSDATDLMYVAANVNTVEFGRSPISGNIEFSCGGRGQGALRASREIGQFIIVIEDMILLEGDPGFTIQDQVMINLNEEVIELQTGSDNLLVTSANEAEVEATSDAVGFPNPTTGPLLFCPGEPGVVPAVALYDASGRYTPLPLEPMSTCFQADLSNLTAGTYWLVHEIEGAARQITIVKQ